VMEFLPNRSGAVTLRLTELQEGVYGTPEVLRRRRRQEQTERLTGIIQALGEKVESNRRNLPALRLRLVQAGYPNASAVPTYLGIRMVLPALLGFGTFMLITTLGQPWAVGVLAGIWGAGIGYAVPGFYIGARINRRQKQMQKALPDALDLLVVCVEAGLGLNQALVRVSEEIDRVSP